MSTRSLIAIKNDNTYTSVYCHFDGYPEGVGITLLENYKSKKKMDDLLALGNISSLSKSIKKPEGHTFDKPQKGYTVFYGRDRGETDINARKHESLQKLIEHLKESWCEYLYIFLPEENKFIFSKISIPEVFRDLKLHLKGFQNGRYHIAGINLYTLDENGKLTVKSM